MHIITGQIWADKKGFKRFLLKLIDKIIFMKSNFLLSDSQNQIKFLYNQGFYKYNIDCLHNGSISGVNTGSFNKSIKDKKNFLKKNLFSPNTKIILYVGRINYSKGILLLTEALKVLNRDFNYNCKLLLIGDDEINFNEILNNKYSDYKNDIILKSYTTNVKFYYSISDIFCLPSYREGFGLSVIEASSSELPVIISDIYGLNDSIVNMKTGIKFKSGNYEDLFLKIKYLLDNPDKMSELGRNGRNFVKNNYESKEVTKFLFNYISKLI